MSHLDAQPPPAPDLADVTPPARDDTQVPTRPARLTRSRRDRMVGGVAGGIAQYFGIDPVLVRFAFVVLALAGGGGVLAYLVAWVVIPEHPEGEEPPTAHVAEQAPMVRVLAGVVLVVLGANWLLHEVVPGATRVTLPLALILVGVIVVVAAGRRGDTTGGGS